MKILLDPGHGGNDPGAVNIKHQIEEEDIALDVVLLLRTILVSKGHIILLTRDRDKKLSPSDRLAKIRQYKPDCFVSIHCNSSNNPNANGIETIYRDEYDKKLAMYIQGKLIEKTELRNRGVKQDGTKEYFRNLAVLKDIETPACLVEIGFINNESELQFILNNKKLIAEAIADGIEERFKVNV